MTGTFPPEIVDHIDRDRKNDTWLNLRLATVLENAQNKTASRVSLSGVVGVSWLPDRQKWQAHIKLKSGSKNLGRFPLIEDAIAARKKAEAEHFPFLAKKTIDQQARLDK